MQSWEHLHTPPRVKGWTLICSLSRHELSHRRDEPPQHSWVSSVVVIYPAHAEAISVKWPQGGSSMRCSHPMHRNSHSRGGQQQQHQSLPQQGPTQSEAHPQTPSRSPSRHVSPLVILPLSQLIGGQLPPSSSCPQLQLYQYVPRERGEPGPMGTALTCPMRCSHPPQKLTVACLPKNPAQKLVQFNLTNQDDLGDSPQLPMNLTSFLEGPGGTANEWYHAWGLPTPTATCPMVRPKMTIPKRKNDPAALHSCQGNHIQVWSCPICWACKHEGLTHTLQI